MNNYSFNIPWDRTVSLVTYSIVIVFTILSVILTYQLLKKGNIYIIITLITFVLTPTLAYIYSPKKYLIKNHNLIIEQGIGSIVIRLNDISHISAVSKDQMKNTTRSFASGGLFGYFGKFNNKSLGSFKMYAANFDGLVLIKLSNGNKLVLSPDNVELFIEMLKGERLIAK